MNKTWSTSVSSQRPVAGLEDSDSEEFHTFSAEEAQAWRQNQPKLSVWWVLGVQVFAALLLATAVYFWFGQWSLFLSLMYGAFSVVVPAALFARGLTSPVASVNAFSATLSFAVWQGVKMTLTVLLMVLAPRLLKDLSWPALLAGLIVTMKVYWLALIWGKKPSKQSPTTNL
jgi:ATP synthase protein I